MALTTYTYIELELEMANITAVLEDTEGILADPIAKWASLSSEEKELYQNSAASWWLLERVMLHDKANCLRTKQTSLLGLLSGLMKAQPTVPLVDPVDQLRITNFGSHNIGKIPDFHELQSLICRPLKKPFPVSPSDYESVLTIPAIKDLIMKSSYSTYSTLFMSRILIPIVCPPSTGESESSFHALWDSLIVQVLLFASTNSSTFRYNRNSAKLMETQSNRPDLSLFVRDYCVFRGKEVGPGRNKQPERELTENLIWTYGSLPYIFGYYAYGYRVKLCVMERGNPDGKVIRRDFGDNYDIRHIRDRCQLVTALLNLAPILEKLAELASFSKALPDGV
ncbi:hypothetical protein HDU79_008912 [Rhizoclosmatium sp. JEL0117]|nr:hypothetical protein HDU79_008912 [Rhizoclosmatium sp. JEL0117]